MMRSSPHVDGKIKIDEGTVLRTQSFASKTDTSVGTDTLVEACLQSRTINNVLLLYITLAGIIYRCKIMQSESCLCEVLNGKNLP